MSQMLGD